jgi:predicted acetyltransferase
MSAVGSVVTHPDHRRKGVFKAMMAYLLQRMSQEGAAISALFPADHRLYQQFAYAAAANWQAYTIAPANLPAFAEAKAVRPFETEDLPVIRSIYRGGQLSQNDGRLSRSNSWWNHLVSKKYRSGNKRIAVYDADGVEGYLKYTLCKENTLHIEEMLVSDDAAWRGLWGFLATQPVQAIEYLAPPDDPVLHLLKVPASSSDGNGWWTSDDFNEVYRATTSFMLRIIDLTEALTSRFYPQNMMGNRVLKIHDPLIPANSQLVNFRIVDGRPDTLPVDAQPPQIESDIATFSQIFCGYLSPETARKLGKLQADDESAAWLGKAMALKPLYIHSGDWF